MKIFIAHSTSTGEEKLAAKISCWLRDTGHNARSGTDLLSDADDPRDVVLRRASVFGSESVWAYDTRADHPRYPVNRFLRDADLLVAVCLDPSWGTGNVLLEIGYFLRRERHLKVILVKGKGVDTPPFLKDHQVITVGARAEFFTNLKNAISGTHETYKKQRGQVFLSYASEDLKVVDQLYRSLDVSGYNIWYDRARLIVGDDWNDRIVREIQDSVAFVACFSERSVDKRGYFQAELRRSLDVAAHYPEGSIFVLPVRLDNCEIPSRFSRYQWCDWSADDGKQRLTAALDKVLDDEWKRLYD